MKKQICSVLFSIVMVNTLISAGCANSNESLNEFATNDTTEQNLTETATELNAFDMLPEADYSGTSFRTITENDIWWQLTDITTEEVNGEVVNDAIYQRNSELKARYNIKFDVTYTPGGGAFNVIKKSIMAQDDAFDYVMPTLNDAAKLAALGLLNDIQNIPNLDLSYTGWDQNGIQDLSISNKLYYAVSDISLGRNEAIWIYMFNKRMAKDFSVENLYQTVKDGEWTFDKY